MELEVFTTNVELQDIPSYSTTISVEGQLLKLSFLWNERLGKRVLSIKNTSDVVYLQNTILHPNEPLELNSNAVLNDLPYNVTLIKTGNVNKVGNIFNWSKDFILCFSRAVDLDVKKLNVVYGVTEPSTPTLPPVVRPPTPPVNNISCEGATNSVIISVVRVGQGNDTTFVVEYEVDGVTYTQEELGQIGLDVQGNEYYAQISNTTNSPVRMSVRFVEYGVHEFVMQAYDSGALNVVEEGYHYEVCLSEAQDISCEGATNISGCVSWEGTSQWDEGAIDLEVDGVKVLSNASKTDLETYLFNNDDIENDLTLDCGCPNGYVRDVYVPYHRYTQGQTLYLPVSLKPNGQSITTPFTVQGETSGDRRSFIADTLNSQLEPYGLYCVYGLFASDNIYLGVTYYRTKYDYKETEFYILDEGNTFTSEEIPRGLPPYTCFMVS